MTLNILEGDELSSTIIGVVFAISPADIVYAPLCWQKDRWFVVKPIDRPKEQWHAFLFILKPALNTHITTIVSAKRVHIRLPAKTHHITTCSYHWICFKGILQEPPIFHGAFPADFPTNPVSLWKQAPFVVRPTCRARRRSIWCSNSFCSCSISDRRRSKSLERHGHGQVAGVGRTSEIEQMGIHQKYPENCPFNRSIKD